MTGSSHAHLHKANQPDTPRLLVSAACAEAKIRFSPQAACASRGRRGEGSGTRSRGRTPGGALHEHLCSLAAEAQHQQPEQRLRPADLRAQEAEHVEVEQLQPAYSDDVRCDDG